MNTRITLTREQLSQISFNEKLKAIENYNYSEETLKILATDESDEIRATVARVTTDVDTQLLLTKDKSSNVRLSLAYSTSNEDVFAELANDYNDVQEAVAENTTSLSLLKKLSKNPYSNVREAVAGNIYASAELLADMASDKDEDEYVKVAIIKNTNTSTETLTKMSENKDEELYVLCALADSSKANDTIFQNLLCCDDLLLLEHIVLNPVASNNILNTIADSVGDAYIEGIVKGRTSERNRAKEALEMIFNNVDMTNIPYETLDFIVENDLVPDSMKDDDLYVLFKKDSKIRERAER